LCTCNSGRIESFQQTDDLWGNDHGLTDWQCAFCVQATPLYAEKTEMRCRLEEIMLKVQPIMLFFYDSVIMLQGSPHYARLHLAKNACNLHKIGITRHNQWLSYFITKRSQHNPADWL